MNPRKSPPALRDTTKILLASVLATSLLAGAAASAAQQAQQAGPPKTTAPAAKRPTRHVAGMTSSARTYYAMEWGVDDLSVRLVESGQLVRFSYRVVDPVKAKPLQDKISEPNLLDEQAHAVLQVPNMEKVGPLRQATAAEDGKSYWMVFSNKGNIVKPGHRVSVVIGQFRVDGLVVR